MLLTIITAIIGGVAVGAGARLLLPGKQNIGIAMTILIWIYVAVTGRSSKSPQR